MVQMHLTVPQHQQGPALSSFAALRVTGKVQPCHAERSEASRCPIEPDPSLRSA